MINMINIKKALKDFKEKLFEEGKSTAQKNFEARWELTGFQKPFVNVKQADGQIKQISLGHTRKGIDGKKVEVQVPLYRFIGWDLNKKYTGEKLRQIRAEQLKKSIEGQTHFSDGTPIIQSQLVDAWV